MQRRLYHQTIITLNCYYEKKRPKNNAIIQRQTTVFMVLNCLLIIQLYLKSRQSLSFAFAQKIYYGNYKYNQLHNLDSIAFHKYSAGGDNLVLQQDRLLMFYVFLLKKHCKFNRKPFSHLRSSPSFWSLSSVMLSLLTGWSVMRHRSLKGCYRWGHDWPCEPTRSNGPLSDCRTVGLSTQPLHYQKSVCSQKPTVLSSTHMMVVAVERCGIIASGKSFVLASNRVISCFN